MGKLLAAGAVALVVLVILLWMQMRSSASPAVAPPRAAPEGPTPATVAATSVSAPTKAEPEPDPERETEAPPAAPAKLDPRSDQFEQRFDEVMGRRLNRNAAKCYEGRHGSLHRNQKLSLTFKSKITNGEVTVHDVKVKESTLGDAALETCFIQEVMRSSWKDDLLPDWEQDDMIMLRPERGMKKFWRDNMEETRGD